MWRFVPWRQVLLWITVLFARLYRDVPIFTACSLSPRDNFEPERPLPRSRWVTAKRKLSWERDSRELWLSCWSCLVHIFRKWASGSRCNFIFAVSWNKITACFRWPTAGGKDRILRKETSYLRFRVDFRVSMRDEKRDINKGFSLDSNWMFIVSSLCIGNFLELFLVQPPFYRASFAVF